MSIHTDKPNRTCGHTYVALRDYFTLWLERLEVFYNSRLEDLDARTTLALAAADKAVTKAETATEKRFEGVNEFRQTLADQANTLLPRSEANNRFENLDMEIKRLGREIQSRRDLEDAAARQTKGWFIPMCVIGLVTLANVVVTIFRH